MSDLSNNDIILKVLEGTKAAAIFAAEKARQHKTPLAIWKDGKVTYISPEEFLSSIHTVQN